MSIIYAKNVVKRYRNFNALNGIDLTIEPGKIVGLIGPNGAGKTSFLRCLLGMATFKGELNVLGYDPRHQRTKMLEDVAFIADTAVLPYWIKVEELLQYMEKIHPKFNHEKANEFLAKTDIKRKSRVKSLSKGMVTQLHLALTISIDAKLLILDEPTLGLDILYRKQFYEQLLNDYYDDERTIVITTHQVEEIENLLTDLVFIKKGEISLTSSMEALANRFYEITVSQDELALARSLAPMYEQPRLGGASLIYDGYREQFSEFKKLSTPSVADLFIATMTTP